MSRGIYVSLFLSLWFHDNANDNVNRGPLLESSENFSGPKSLRSAYSVKLIFSYVVKGIKIKITAKFHASRRLRYEDTKRIVSSEMRSKSFGTFEKQAPEPKPNIHSRSSIAYGDPI